MNVLAAGRALTLRIALLAGPPTLLAGCANGAMLVPLWAMDDLRQSIVSAPLSPDPFNGLPAASPLDGPDDGVLIPEAPKQVLLTPPRVLLHNDAGMTITAEATYDIKARVLRVEPYWFDQGAALVPRDYVLGWQSMSSNRLLRHVVVQQWGRFYSWSPTLARFSARTINNEAANNHLIPSTPAVRAQLANVQVGQLIELKGFLVNVDHTNGDYWHSSLTRDDVGDGACELMYVTEVTWLRREPVALHLGDAGQRHAIR